MDIDRARMPTGDNVRHPARRVVPGIAPGTTGWILAGLALCATAALASASLPPPLVLLATGSALALAGLALAAALYLAGKRMGRDGTVGWDAAASLAFLGFAAALLTDTGEAMKAFAELRAR